MVFAYEIYIFVHRNIKYAMESKEKLMKAKGAWSLNAHRPITCKVNAERKRKLLEIQKRMKFALNGSFTLSQAIEYCIEATHRHLYTNQYDINKDVANASHIWTCPMRDFGGIGKLDA